MTSIPSPPPVTAPRARPEPQPREGERPAAAPNPAAAQEPQDTLEQARANLRRMKRALGPFGFMVRGLRVPGAVAPAPRRPQPRPWRGPTPLQAISSEVSGGDRKTQYENIEQFYLRNNNNEAVLVPWQDFDATKPPLIIVHGITDSAYWMEDLAEHFRAQGKQVFMLMYDDKNTNPDAAGQQMAKQMKEIRRRYYGTSTKLEVVGHSLGALVSRAALNSLQRPGWLYGPNSTPPAPRGGFSEVSFLALDAPWAGVSGPINQLKLWYGVNHLMEDFTSLNNVTAGDKLMTRMQSVPLPGVTMTYARATSRGDDFLPDNEHSKQFESLWDNAMPMFKEFDHPPIARLAEFVMADEISDLGAYYRDYHPAHRNTYGYRDTDTSLPKAFPPPMDGRLANIGRAIRGDHRVVALRKELKREWGRIRKSGKRFYSFDEAVSHAFQRAYARVMPPIDGNHATIVNDTGAIDGLLRGMSR